MIPFFVVDRPISLRIIGGLRIPAGKRIGLMAHANTSVMFRRAFREYAYHPAIKMCDSAIFYTGRGDTTHRTLFDRYEDMGADYGVMKDVLGDSSATIKNAKDALKIFTHGEFNFKLVGVAQGSNVREYMHCYEKLRQLGFTHIAIGGLLRKRDRSARYMHVHEETMRQVLFSIRQTYQPDWLFALGCFHPSRLELFQQLEVWGDYKGWIFEYEKRDATIKHSIQAFTSNHLAHASPSFLTSSIGIELQARLKKRRYSINKSNAAHLDLLSAKRALRDVIIEVEQTIRKVNPESLRLVAQFRSRGLLRSRERDQIAALLCPPLASKYKEQLNRLMKISRQRKTEYVRTERKKEYQNKRLLAVLLKASQTSLLDHRSRILAKRILKVLGTSEQSHRIAQVRCYIEQTILDRI